MSLHPPTTTPPAATPPPAISRRRLLQGGAALALAGLSLRVRSATPRLRRLGEVHVPHRQPFAGTLIGGLSGLDFDAASGRWFFICDDTTHGPARLYTARLPLDRGALAPPVWEDMLTLRQPSGAPYPPRLGLGTVADPEAVRWRADTGTLLWTSEGDSLRGQPPALIETAPDGSERRRFELPAMFQPGLRQGPRFNRSFEGLALAPDGRHAWVAMEGPLWEDGPEARDGDGGAPCRFTAFDLLHGSAVRQLAYQPEGVDGNGVVEILFDGPDHLLVLERAWSRGRGNTLRLFRIAPGTATDVLAMPRLDARVAVPKQLLADFAGLGLSRLDNTEGMAWGPALPGGGRSLVVVSDDNFNPGQITQIVAFEYLD